jgi:hypothetical protein
LTFPDDSSISRSTHHRPDVFNAMTAKNRAGLITKLQSSLKKHYKPAPAAPGRPLMEHVLYAALLEDAPVDIADEGFAKCEQEFFDWNEVRVTSVTELAEVLSHFPSPATTAQRLKRCLQSVFESFYSFEIEHLKKENLGKAVAKFESMNGVSPFVLSYLVQHGLGGHAIPVNSSGMWIMFKTGIVNEAEARTGKVPGLERAIPKSKAIEFSSMLHQAAVALAADATCKQVWEIVWSVNKDAEMSAPQSESKRRSAKRPAQAAAAESKAETKSESKASGKPKSAAKAAPAEVESTAKPAKQPAAKPSAKSKTASEPAKATEESTKTMKSETTATDSAAKAKAKAKPAAVAEKAKPAEAKKSTESKKPAEVKKSAEPKASDAKPSAATKATPSPKPTAAAKSTKSDAVSKDSANDQPKESAAKSPKKSTSAKTPRPTAETGPEPAESAPVKEASKKAEPKSPKEATPAAGVGNQKLTKRKPR